MKEHCDGEWFKDYVRGAICYIPPGVYEVGEAVKPEISIPRHAYEMLLDFIRQHETGVMRTDRTEDLKLINRLLDIIQNIGEMKTK